MVEERRRRGHEGGKIPLLIAVAGVVSLGYFKAQDEAERLLDGRLHVELQLVQFCHLKL